MRPRYFLVSLLVISLSGCALPPLPKLPALPRLPALPKLPRLTPANETEVVSKGQTLLEAYHKAVPVAETWSEVAYPVKAQGTSIDDGGRNGGHKGGVWMFTFQSDQPGKTDQWLEVRVEAGGVGKRQANRGGIELPSMGLELTGLIDSPDAVARAGLPGKQLTVVLTPEEDTLVYNVVEEGGVGRVVLNAWTGEKDPGRSI